MPSEITIYHNPACGTSRNVLTYLQENGFTTHVVEYLKTPPDKTILQNLIQKMGIRPRQLLREKGTPYVELQLDDEKWTDEQLIDFMVQHPILINRPIVVSGEKAMLCRPSESIKAFMDSLD